MSHESGGWGELEVCAARTVNLRADSPSLPLDMLEPGDRPARYAFENAMKLKPLPYLPLALAALLAFGCSPTSTPSGGAGQKVAQNGSDTTNPVDDTKNAPIDEPTSPAGETPAAPAKDDTKKNAPENTMGNTQRPSAGGGGGGGGGRRGGGGGMGFLLAMEPVKKELGLTDDQVTKIQAAIPQNMREMSSEEREKATQKMQEDMKKILKPEQTKRLQELQYQMMGPRALTTPAVSKELGLSDDQVKRITSALEIARPPAGGGGDAAPSPEQMEKIRENRAKMREEANAKALAVLTAEQKKKWDAMLGKKFEFPAPQFGGGGGGGMRAPGDGPPRTGGGA